MEKSRSFPQYSSSFSGEFGPFDDRRRRAGDHNKAYSFNGPSQKWADDPEAKRKKRIAAYNVFTVEGKLKSSVRNSFKWIKTKFTTNTDDSRYGI
ncbi:unnamed protein product [Linum tenue]|uniref:Uncharacterized protein n=1 Tax=Linum tenue TaxID=586396 RepID=A0AAV0IFG6_9ROSI|nr:unnamed protein product [Linum tenue]